MIYFVDVFMIFFCYFGVCLFNGLMRKVVIVVRIEVICIFSNFGFFLLKFIWLILLLSVLFINGREKIDFFFLGEGRGGLNSLLCGYG